MAITEELVDFVTGMRYERLPAHIVDLAKSALLDSIGTTLLGTREECGRIAAATVRGWDSGPQSTVIGTRMRASAPLAAMVNGTAGHALDYDDASVNIHGHASVAIMPAALALGETRGSSGKDVLTAYAMAYEVGQRVSNAVNPKHYALGWHTTSSIGTLRAVTSASRVLGLDAAATRRAFGIAASMACGLNQNFGTMTKPLHAGLAAKNGVIAAQLAGNGYTADANILEAEHGFCDTFCAGQPYEAARITADLGKTFCLEEPGIVFKPYPCCRASHPVIDGLIEMRAKYGLRPEQIEKVRCGVSWMRVRIMRYHDPQTSDEARFSMEHNAAVALADGRAGVAQFTLEKLRDPVIRDLMGRVEMYIHPTMTEKLIQSAELDIVLKDGRTLNHWVEMPLGSPGNPMPHALLVDKFRECADGTLTAAATNEAIALLEDLENLPDLGRLMRALATTVR